MDCHSVGVVTQFKAEWGGTSGKEHRPPGCKCKCLREATLSLWPLGHSGRSPQIREQFANLASGGLAFLIGLGLDGIHPGRTDFLGTGGEGVVTRRVESR